MIGTCNQNKFADAEVPRIDDSPVNATEVREVATGMHDIFIRCNASGAPIPKLSIIFPMKVNFTVYI